MTPWVCDLFDCGTPTVFRDTQKDFPVFVECATDGRNVDIIQGRSRCKLCPDRRRCKPRSMASNLDFRQHVPFALRDKHIADVVRSQSERDFHLDELHDARE